VETAKVQNSLGNVLVQDDLNVEEIIDVLAKLKTIDSSLEKGSIENGEGKKKSLLRRLKRLLLMLRMHQR